MRARLAALEYKTNLKKDSSGWTWAGPMHRVCWYILRVLAACAVVVRGPVAHAEDCQLKQAPSLDTTTSNDGWVLAPVEIENSRRLFAVDLSQEYSVLTESMARAMQLKFVVQEWGGTYKFPNDMKFEAGATIKFDDASGRSSFVIFPGPIGNDLHIAGFLALDVLEQFDVELDLAHHKINLFTKNHCPNKVVYWTHCIGRPQRDSHSQPRLKGK